MSGMVAADALEPASRDVGSGAAAGSGGREAIALAALRREDAGPQSSPIRTTNRRLHDALADLGPARPANAETASAADSSSPEIKLFAEAPAAPHLVVIPELATTNLYEIGKDGEELVRALAAADIARGRHVAAIAPEADMEPAPMIIERARAEQELGIVPAMPTMHRLNPVPGLLVGLLFSIAAGIGLYVAMVPG